MHPDVELMARVSNSDPAALGVILERYWSTLVRYATGLLRNRDEAEDVAVETFERLWERRDAWQITGSILPLLLRITRNSSLDALRKRSARSRSEASDVLQHPPISPAEAVEEDELRAIVTQAMDSLPAKRREVLILTRMHGLSRNEVADVMGLAPQTVANHLRLALDDLRVSLAPYFYETHDRPIRHQVDATA